MAQEYKQPEGCKTMSTARYRETIRWTDSGLQVFNMINVTCFPAFHALNATSAVATQRARHFEA